MQSSETSRSFSLASVKPFQQLENYRAFCIQAMQRALSKQKSRRTISPITGSPLEAYGSIGTLEYLRCPKTGSLFLAELPSASEWTALLTEIARFRNAPEGFHGEVRSSRSANVYQPKMEWIENSLLINEVRKASLLEVITLPTELSQRLKQSSLVDHVAQHPETVPENPLPPKSQCDAAILLESLDRTNDPLGLLQSVEGQMKRGGLLFVTALVSSGFDFSILGLRNHYLYPPDRTNCFSLAGLQRLIEQVGFELIEVSTPGVLDVEIVRAHKAEDPTIPLSSFEKSVIDGNPELSGAFQSFLQQNQLSSFARIVGRKK